MFLSRLYSEIPIMNVFRGPRAMSESTRVSLAACIERCSINIDDDEFNDRGSDQNEAAIFS